MRTFGLIGKRLDYSFSKNYFTEKFKSEKILDAEYRNFEISAVSDFKSILESEPNLSGLNVTIPYKQEIIPYVDELDQASKEIGAINTIIFKRSKLIGSNTDVYGFQRSLAAILKPRHERALILGTGGASKAVAYVLKQLGVEYKLVSRNPAENQFSYSELNEYVLKHFKLIINTSPLGTYPNVEECPKIPFQFVTDQHLFYDLVYNPEKTSFLKQAESKGAAILNGYRMLQLQAEKSWELWNE